MLWIGTYEAKGGKGLYPLELAGGALRLGEPERRIANASFAVWSQRTRTAWFVDEREEGGVAAWRRQGGDWLPLGRHASGGALPCYLSVDAAGEWLAAANYGDGSVALLALDPRSGAIRELSDLARHAGSGPDAERQSSPHVHCALFDEEGRWLYVTDLGLDRVFRYAPRGGTLGEPEVAFEAPPGSGPRHLLLHPDGRHLLLLCELSAELVLLERGPAGFSPLDIVQTAPERADGNLGGHLALTSDARILVTNRGHDSLVGFDIEGGRLKRCGWHASGSESPRHFRVCGGRAIVAHEEGGRASLVPLPGQDGGTVQSVGVPGAAFVLEVPD